jgi:hypothetical protein
VWRKCCFISLLGAAHFQKKKVNKWLLLLVELFKSKFGKTQQIRLLSGRGFGVTE